ncbi:MAG: ABC transporter permease, partial [Anaerolineae bacterium]
MSIALPLSAMLTALLIGAVLLLLLGANPARAYSAMITGVFGSVFGITQSLVKATPLLLVAVSVSICFRAQVWNIGAEGQMILGAIFSTWVGLHVKGLP